MGNLIGVGAQCRRGDEIILGKKSHLFQYEGTGASAFMGVAYHTLDNLEDGGLDTTAISGALRGDDPHYPRSALLCLENTQNLCGARAIGVERMEKMCAAARRGGLKVHVDGARLWNAAVTLGVRPSELVAEADTVTVCLSKGLGAPVGSVLVGSAEFIYHARRLRKSLGGGMRQAGVIAAAGLEAVVNNYVRLQEVTRSFLRLECSHCSHPCLFVRRRLPDYSRLLRAGCVRSRHTSAGTANAVGCFLIASFGVFICTLPTLPTPPKPARVSFSKPPSLQNLPLLGRENVPGQS
ncbi:unnamed protein product [Ascophyllum nodosum]